MATREELAFLASQLDALGGQFQNDADRSAKMGMAQMENTRLQKAMETEMGLRSRALEMQRAESLYKGMIDQAGRRKVPLSTIYKELADRRPEDFSLVTRNYGPLIESEIAAEGTAVEDTTGGNWLSDFMKTRLGAGLSETTKPSLRVPYYSDKFGNLPRYPQEVLGFGAGLAKRGFDYMTERVK